MATTVTRLLTTTITTTSSTPSSTHRATPQGGLFEGLDPSEYNPTNPIILFIIQAGIIIIFCRLLHYPLSWLKQPRVIAEVIGGILLGPSVMMRIPGFQDAIFPEESMPNLTLVANLGLVLFLFLVGLEVDLRYLASNWKIALSVGAAGMTLPFGLGCAIAWGLYNEFRDEPDTEYIGFGVYMLFIGVAMAITAFPVLCRILTELKLLGTPVGIIVLSAGVGNDVVGWVLLALCVALVNASSGVAVVWILLTCVGYVLFLVYAVRPAFLWYLNRTGSIQDGPSQSVVALTLLIALASSFFTGVIGVHAIFGAFMAGLICPHEGGFAIKLTEKIEDLVTALFLPLYFALSGLNTNLGLLDSGVTWAYVVGVIAVAFCAKIIGGSGAARLNGLVWRECLTIGSLMSCKGLVELIVLNIGLQAKILSTRTFTIFVVMALVTTFATTPLVVALYPPWYQKKLEAWKRGEIDWDTGKAPGEPDSVQSEDMVVVEKLAAWRIRNILLYLRIDSMPGLFTLVALIGGANERTANDAANETLRTIDEHPAESSASTQPHQTMNVHGVRLIQLTDRNSSVMKVSEVEEYSHFDPVVNTFRSFGRLHNVAVSGEVAVAPEHFYADTLTTRASELSSDLLLLPWSETGSLSEFQTPYLDEANQRLDSGPYRDFVHAVVSDGTCNTAVFINTGFGGGRRPSRPNRLTRTFSNLSMRSQVDTPSAPLGKQSHHIFFPYIGSADDRLACRFVLRLARDPRLTVNIVHFKVSSEVLEHLPPISPVTTRKKSEAKDFATSTATETLNAALPERHAAFVSAMHSSLPADIRARVTLETVSCQDPTTEIVERARAVVSSSAEAAGDLIVVGRNTLSSDGSALGEVGDALCSPSVNTSVLVLQAARA